MKTIVAKCGACGATKPLVPNVDSMMAYRHQRKPSICFDCWLAGPWKKLKADYLISLGILLFVMIPLFTVLFWSFYPQLVKQNNPHWDDPKRFTMLVCLPTMLGIGGVPFFACQLWLLPRYGPKLELMNGFSRFFMDLAPMLLYAVTTFLAFFALIYFCK